MPVALLKAAAVWVASLTAAKVAAYVAVLMYGVYTSRRQAKRARSSYEASVRDRKVMIRSSEAPHAFVYGNPVVSGPLVYARTTGDKGQFLHYVIALAAHELAAIEEIYLDSEPLGPLDSEGRVTQGKYFRKKPVSATERFVCPASGGTVTPAQSNIKEISTVAVSYGPEAYQGDIIERDAAELEKGVEYVVSDAGVITMTGIRPNFVGKTLIVTYVYESNTALVQVKKFLGIAGGERDLELETLTEGDFTSTMVGDRIAKIRVTIEYDEEMIGGVIPNTSARVQGKKVYDPRSDSFAYSNNPILCILDYLRSDYGFNCSADEIDYALAIEQANICEEQVRYNEAGDTHDRFTLDGALYADAAPRDNLREMLSSCVGSATYSAGQWRVFTAAYREPVVILEADDYALGEVTTIAAAPRRELFNSVRGQFINPDKHYALDDFEPYESAPYIAEDGEVIFKDFQFGMTQDAIRAQRLAKLLLFVSRQAIVDEASFKAHTIPLQPGDRVLETRAFDGWDRKPFRITARTYDPQTHTVRLTRQEDAPEIYDSEFDEFKTPDPAPDTTFPPPEFVRRIEGLEITSGATQYEVATDGTIISHVLIEWDPVVGSEILRGGHILIRWKRATEDTFRDVRLDPTATSYKIEPVNARQTLNIEIYAVNGLNIRSAPLIEVHRVDVNAPPSGRPATGGNVLSGASFTSGTVGWITLMSPFQNVSDVKTRNHFARAVTAEQSLPGSVDNAILDIQRLVPPPNLGWALSAPFLVDPSVSYHLQAFVKGCFAKPIIAVALYDADGEFVAIRQVFSGTRHGDEATYEDVPPVASLDSSDLSTYFRMYGVLSKSMYGGRTVLFGRFAVGGQTIRETPGYSGQAFISVAQPMVMPAGVGVETPVPRWFAWQPGREDFVTPDRYDPGMVGYQYAEGPYVPLPFTIENNARGFISFSFPPNPDDYSMLRYMLEVDVSVAQLAGANSRVEIREVSNNVVTGFPNEGPWRPLVDVIGQSQGFERREIKMLTGEWPSRGSLSSAIRFELRMQNAASARLNSARVYWTLIK